MNSVQQVGEVLESYAQRGMFRAFSRQHEGRSRGAYRLLWHRQQVFDWQWQGRERRLRVHAVLPNVPARSPMDKAFRQWLALRADPALPAHRRCDPDKMTIKAYNRDANLSLSIAVLDDDIDYAVRRSVALVNEIYLDFLANGPYFDWQVETFDLDPDNPY